MKIAVTYENGEVFQHFGHTEQFKIYETADGEVKNSEVVSTMGSGHGALAGFLKEHGADTLICGGIGQGAQDALKEAGITFFGGVCGSADQAVEDLLKDQLSYDANVMCSHHDEEDHHHGSCGEHGCGRH
ncbi:NifB/NifX family molybdenum-iron cluster-binding protein [Anaerostipes sp.]|uniref:NifB/NifX family molybdenum-iron cluster-binding protein n=1 Tax=Anaerostipes sp. TaxID=1872530 RepID=UPI0025BA1798|nr:NifB/NifX family molybdenum-iron cluster-binding protein [Anaerostipes sp.]MBS7008851.1 NifB/NifX family molybdenum-iron cluster-binding protein [Anaerostipes sp.]